MNLVLALVVVFVLSQFAIGILASRVFSSERGFILADRQIGLVIGAFTVFATWFGSESIIGAAGTLYADGLVAGGAEPFGYALALVAAGLVIAAPLWRRGYLTFGDFFRARFSPGVERLAVVMMLPGPVIWGAAQIRAFGQVMGVESALPLVLNMTLATVVVVAYTAIGGMLANAWTDLVQGVVIIVGLVILAASVAAAVGGVGPGLAAVEPARLAYFSVSDAGTLGLLETWAIPICGSIVSVEIISRMLAMRSAETARAACVLGGILYLVVGLLPAFVGLVGPTLMPGLAEPEQIVPALGRQLLPSLLYAVLVAAIVSAILSTVSAVLLAGGALVSHNILQRLHPETSEARRLAVTRLSVVGLGGAAYLIAVGAALAGASIADLVESASAFASSGLFVAAVMGLFSRWGGARSAYAALVAGAGVWAVLSLANALSVPLPGPMSTAPYVVSLVIALAAYTAAALVWAHEEPATAG